MKNKIEQYYALVWERVSSHRCKVGPEEVLPVWGEGPLNAPVMAIGIDGDELDRTKTEEVKEYMEKRDRVFLARNHPDQTKIREQTPRACGIWSRRVRQGGRT